MENNQTNGLTEELLKQFSLQECFKMFPISFSVNEFTEMDKLRLLRNRLKNLLELFGMIHHYPFSESHKLEKALGRYMVDTNVSKKERLAVNELMSLYMQLTTKIGITNDLVSAMLCYYSKRYNEIDELIEAEEGLSQACGK